MALATSLIIMALKKKMNELLWLSILIGQVKFPLMFFFFQQGKYFAGTEEQKYEPVLSISKFSHLFRET